MNSEIISIIFLCGIVFTFLIDYVVVYVQTKNKIGQVLRLLGPKTHLRKSSTPTLGGIGFIVVFLFLITISKYIFNLEINLLLLSFPLFMYALLGFIDDLLILIKKNNDGISSTIKLLLQMIIAIGYFYILLKSDSDLSIQIFTFNIYLKWIYGVIVMFLLIGFTNATNLTDGLDGLLAGCSIISLFGTFLISLSINRDISFIILIFISSLLGFLILNYPKAKIFMGNIGAYAIGAFIVTLCIVLKIEMYLLLLGAIYIIEALSVIIQVIYFKITKGKRIFKMSPIHHHYELKGLKEIDVLYLFYVIQIICVFAAVIIHKGYS